MVFRAPRRALSALADDSISRSLCPRRRCLVAKGAKLLRGRAAFVGHVCLSHGGVVVARNADFLVPTPSAVVSDRRVFEHDVTRVVVANKEDRGTMRVHRVVFDDGSADVERHQVAVVVDRPA